MVTTRRSIAKSKKNRSIWLKNPCFSRIIILYFYHFLLYFLYSQRNKNRLKIRESQQGKCIKIKRPAHLSVPILTLIAIFSFAVSIRYSIVQYFHPTWLPIPLLLASFPLTFLDRISPSHILILQLAGYLIPKHIGLECGLFPCR